MSRALMKTLSMLHRLTCVATVDAKLEISDIMHKCDGVKQRVLFVINCVETAIKKR